MLVYFLFKLVIIYVINNYLKETKQNARKRVCMKLLMIKTITKAIQIKPGNSFLIVDFFFFTNTYSESKDLFMFLRVSVCMPINRFDF